MTATPFCAVCGAEATGRCGTCRRVYCVEHYTIKGGGMVDIHIECDSCAEKRDQATAQFRAEEAETARIGCLIGVVTTIAGMALIYFAFFSHEFSLGLLLAGAGVIFVWGLIATYMTGQM